MENGNIREQRRERDEVFGIEGQKYNKVFRIFFIYLAESKKTEARK